MPDRLDATFAALADPTRRAILARLTGGEAMVTELAAPFDISLPAVSRHLKVLQGAGLISRGRQAQWRPCRLEAEPLKEVVEWAGEFRRFWDESFDRLDAYLQTLQEEEHEREDRDRRHHVRPVPADDGELLVIPGTSASAPSDFEFVISRIFDAPRDRLWAVWTEADHLAEWFGPAGVTIVDCHNDLRPGGRYLYHLRTPDGLDYRGKWTYREIVPEERLVFLVSFADEEWNTVRNPWSEEWPLETLSTVTFTDHEEGTLVTVRWSPHQATGAERRAFEEGAESMRQGWAGTFERLAGYLAES